MIIIGLTGSIAMGKSETAKLFAEMGIPVFDSDAEVHRQYSRGGLAVPAVASLFPGAVVDGEVDRGRLSIVLLGDERAIAKLESVVHPIIKEQQARFLAECRREGAKLAVLDIPLLFETGRAGEVDKVVVVSAPEDVQRVRALARPGMTEKKLALIIGRQVPDDEKRRLADYVVDSSKGLAAARAQVRSIVKKLSEEISK